ncbi:MAG: FKBP-type peptidyl-prolyl cis-trans isomerase [Candidatus Helarchaeota archaeon]|nr:FKBP-type peptidyl-prolyl cis-trans isomerase [Candidatus Helarchaeota archaeon]
MIGRIKSNNKLFDVTSEEIAKKEGVYSEKDIYGPRLVVVGEGGSILDGLSKEVENMTIGETKKIELAPKDAFGQKDIANIKRYSERELIKKYKIEPRKSLGRRVNIGGKAGYIVNVSGGRVRVDFNHPLAGETVIYEITVNKKLKDDTEKIQQFINMYFGGVATEKFDFNILIDEKKVSINLPYPFSLMQGIGNVKFRISQSIFQFIENVENVEFIEVMEKKMFMPSEEHTNHDHPNHEHST